MFSLQHTIRNFWGLFHHQRFAVRDPDNTAADFFFCQANLSYQERERENERDYNCLKNKMKALHRSRCYDITNSNCTVCYAWPAVAGKLLILM